NGEPVWTAARQVSELIASPPGRLSAYQPRFSYYLFDEGRIDDETLQRVDNTVASLVQLEASPSPQAIREQITRLSERLRDPVHDSLRRAFTVWINRLVIPRMIP